MKIVANAIVKTNETHSFFSKTNSGIAPHILGNRKYFPFFQNCIGALDGSHIPANVNVVEQTFFRNRKGRITQNILGAVDFNLMFTYALVGWEGSAHDGRVLSDSILKGLPLLPGKYYLGDAGYALTKYCLTPYRSVRYHLKEW
jgi:hypothetical protein